MTTKKKYYSFFEKPFFVLSLLLFTLKLNAQTGTYADTLIHSEEQTGGTNSEQQNENYFLTRDDKAVQKDSFQLRKLPAAELKKMQNDDAFWYANANIKRKVADEKEGTSLGDQQWFRTLLWLIIIGGFAAFIMIYLANSNISLFSRKNMAIENNLDEEVETDNIFEINYQKEIEKAVKNKDYRFAIRLHFLRLLKDLSLKNILQYKQGRTNFDYLLQLGSTDYYKDFFRLTRNYEYSWYGKFNVTETAYNVIRDDFNRFEKKLPYS